MYSSMESVTTRMDEDAIARVERLADALGVSRSDAIRIALEEGVRDELVRVALERYREGDVGMRGAAELAGVTIAEMMAEAQDRGVLSNLDPAELADDVEALR
jgi:predicted HTH domain antitoxin